MVVLNKFHVNPSSWPRVSPPRFGKEAAVIAVHCWLDED
jgi:hypothetical protein